MRLIEAHDGKLLTLNSNNPSTAEEGKRTFSSGLSQLDSMAPGGGFSKGAVHELMMAPADGKPLFLAMLLASAALRKNVESRDSNFGSTVIWCDPAAEIYPPALAALGFPIDRLFLLRLKIPDPRGKNLLWAIAECLRCKGVGAVVAMVPRLSRIEARRLQLSAEAGGGTGIFLRQPGRESAHHAASTRWLVRPVPGERTTQRWTIQLLHGHGGLVGHTLCLEHSRETNHLHTFTPVADRSLVSESGVTKAS